MRSRSRAKSSSSLGLLAVKALACRRDSISSKSRYWMGRISMVGVTDVGGVGVDVIGEPRGRGQRRWAEGGTTLAILTKISLSPQGIQEVRGRIRTTGVCSSAFPAGLLRRAISRKRWGKSAVAARTLTACKSLTSTMAADRPVSR